MLADSIKGKLDKRGGKHPPLLASQKLVVTMAVQARTSRGRVASSCCRALRCDKS